MSAPLSMAAATGLLAALVAAHVGLVVLAQRAARGPFNRRTAVLLQSTSLTLTFAFLAACAALEIPEHLGIEPLVLAVVAVAVLLTGKAPALALPVLAVVVLGVNAFSLTVAIAVPVLRIGWLLLVPGRLHRLPGAPAHVQRRVQSIWSTLERREAPPTVKVVDGFAAAILPTRGADVMMIGRDALAAPGSATAEKVTLTGEELDGILWHEIGHATEPEIARGLVLCAAAGAAPAAVWLAAAGWADPIALGVCAMALLAQLTWATLGERRADRLAIAHGRGLALVAGLERIVTAVPMYRAGEYLNLPWWNPHGQIDGRLARIRRAVDRRQRSR